MSRVIWMGVPRRRSHDSVAHAFVPTHFAFHSVMARQNARAARGHAGERYQRQLPMCCRHVLHVARHFMCRCWLKGICRAGQLGCDHVGWRPAQTPE